MFSNDYWPKRRWCQSVTKTFSLWRLSDKPLLSDCRLFDRWGVISNCIDATSLSNTAFGNRSLFDFWQTNVKNSIEFFSSWRVRVVVYCSFNRIFKKAANQIGWKIVSPTYALYSFRVSNIWTCCNTLNKYIWYCRSCYWRRFLLIKRSIWFGENDMPSLEKMWLLVDYSKLRNNPKIDGAKIVVKYNWNNKKGIKIFKTNAIFQGSEKVCFFQRIYGAEIFGLACL